MPACVFMLRRSDRGTTYRALDVVQVFDAYNPDLTLREFVLPPADPFAFVKVEGIALADALIYQLPQVDPETGALLNKRWWFLRQQSVPSDVKDYFMSHWFVGFGSAGDQAMYGSVVSGDMALQWSEVQTWIQQK